MYTHTTRSPTPTPRACFRPTCLDAPKFRPDLAKQISRASLPPPAPPGAPSPDRESAGGHRLRAELHAHEHGNPPLRRTCQAAAPAQVRAHSGGTQHQCQGGCHPGPARPLLTGTPPSPNAARGLATGGGTDPGHAGALDPTHSQAHEPPHTPHCTREPQHPTRSRRHKTGEPSSANSP